MKKHVYRVEVEVTHMEGTQLPEDCGGGFVNVYICANSIVDAIQSVEEALISDCYKPIETSAAFALDLEELDGGGENIYEEDGEPSLSDLNNLKINGGLWYSAFHLYPPEGNDVH